MIPQEAGIGYETGDPVAESYDEYPEGKSDMRAYEYRDIIHEVLEAVEGYEYWAAVEMDVPITTVNEFVRKHGREYPEGELHVTLNEHMVERGEHQDRYHPRVSYHRGRFKAAGPLEDDQFIQAALRRGYDAEDIASLFGDLDESEVQETLVDRGYVEQEYVVIDGERYDFDKYHKDPYKDARLLAAFDNAGYTVTEVARELGVTGSDVRKQVRLHRMTE